jgi:hypothetical protein
MGAHRVVVPPPLFDYYLSLSQRVEDFFVEQLIAKLVSLLSG